MKIKYITNVRLPTPRAQGYAIMKVCSEMSRAGAEVELFVPERVSTVGEKDPFAFYGLPADFAITKIPSTDFLAKTLKFGRLFYWLDIISFLVAARLKIDFTDDSWIYSRDFLVALFFPKRYHLAIELHDLPSNKFLLKWALGKTESIFVLNRFLKEELQTYGIPGEKTYISPSGVELADFNIETEVPELRQKLDLPLDRKIILYTGHLYEWKGAETLASAAAFLPEQLFVFVGGVEPELSRFRQKYMQFKNILVRPAVERQLVPLYLKAADVLVVPNSAKEKISVKYTSPLKLLEYMAAQRPIVASDLPSIREVLNPENAFLAEADNPADFARAIQECLTNDRTSQMVQNAFATVQKFSWQEKVKNILNHLK